MSIAQHNAHSNEWGTPSDVIEAARACMGGIDLDPATSAAANERVLATGILYKEHDALRWPWGTTAQPQRVFLNPPGGSYVKRDDGSWQAVETETKESGAKRRVKGVKGRAVSSQFVWWDKLVTEFCEGRVLEAVYVGFTLELLQRSQRARLPIHVFNRCYPRERLEFAPLEGQQAKSPTHANVLVHLARPDAQFSWQRFAHAFSSLGLCEPSAERIAGWLITRN